MMNLKGLSPCMYAIVCSKKTKEQWHKAVRCLHDKYNVIWPGKVRVIKYDDSVEQALPELQRLRPSYCCFVAIHSECSRSFVRSVHSVTRKIDPSNPFTDTLWGILTGQEEDDVVFAVQQVQDSLCVSRVLGGTGVNLKKFESGVWYSEGEQGVAYRKKLGSAEACKESCAPDATGDIVAELSSDRDEKNDKGVDMVITSGHATEHDWNIGYNFRSGQLIPMDGNICGLTVNGDVIPVQCRKKPKIYSACGNCLMGHISEKNCMALAWMHSANVIQMTGYIVETWFGYAGWGVHKYFINNPGMMTFAESFFANQQSLITKLHKDYPEFCDKSVGEANSVYKKCFNTKATARKEMTRECSGLLYDQDSLAFYGDPAYEARIAIKKEEWDYDISIMELDPAGLSPGWSKWELKVKTVCHGSFECPIPDDKTTSFGRPPVFVFPCSMRDFKVLEGEAVINCRFILVSVFGNYTPGKEFKVVFAVQL
ncbi:uncharacterized protein [Dysidea avara]|uniref:uncharacterized protein n=1 Tax=Dysidea avara TaxID=196820 RepID=UPI00332C814F